jgi:hypothetical protein
LERPRLFCGHVIFDRATDEVLEKWASDRTAQFSEIFTSPESS